MKINAVVVIAYFLAVSCFLPSKIFSDGKKKREKAVQVDELDVNLEEQVRQAIQEELFYQGVEVPRTAEKGNLAVDENLQKKIKQKVHKEIKRQLFHDEQRQRKDIVYSDKKHDTRKQPLFIYKVPSWPFYSLFYEQKDLFQVTLSGNAATQSYASLGGSQDMSNLVFGQDPITIQDILLVSKLAKLNKVEAVGAVGGVGGVGGNPDKNDFVTLADQPVVFDASTWQLAGSLNFARHFRKGDILFGFQVPFVFRKNNLKLSSEITDARRSLLRSDRFKSLSLRQLLDLILGAKGMTFNDHSSQAGAGDITMFVHYQVPTKKCERLVVGFNAVFPTARGRNTQNLWDPEIGNGGFTEISGFTSALWGVHRLLNPHVHVRGTYSFPANVQRRVPKHVIFDGMLPAGRVGGFILDDLMILGNNVKLINNEEFNELDSTVRGFADTSRKTKMRKGPELFIRIGNIFERILFSKAFLDVYYDVRLKGQDYLGFRRHDDEFDPSLLTRNTAQIEHRLGFDYSYQFDNNIRLALGTMYSIDGRNVPKTFEAHLAFNVEF